MADKPEGKIMKEDELNKAVDTVEFDNKIMTRQILLLAVYCVGLIWFLLWLYADMKGLN